MATGKTEQEAAADAIRWGQVCISTYLMTHEPRINTAINHARHLDEALISLWHCIAVELVTQGWNPPQMTTAKEMRRWMRDPTNAPLLDTIKKITLIERKLKVILPELNTLCKLQHLHLRCNQITQVGRLDFAGCLSLRYLHLEFNQIAQIHPEAFAGCSRLRCLNLKYNQITQVSCLAFAGCQRLQELQLEENQITQITQQTLTGCGALELLDLTRNKIAQIGPEVFTGCLRLQKLRLEYNQITQLAPQAFAGCSSLQELVLGNNQITQIGPEVFAGCLSLAQLHLGGNEIAQIPPQAFAGCPALQQLYLGNNPIAQIAPQAFAGCLNLQRLYLMGNQIAQIAPQAFTGCLNLLELYLGYNQITQLASQAFAGCLRLQKLELDHNQIAQIAPQAFAGCPALEWLNLEGNPTLCATALSDENYLEKVNAFSQYVCRSELAAFYKAVSEGTLSTLEIVEHVKQLEERNLIYEMVYWEAKAAAKRERRVFSDEGDHQWGEHHVCDAMPVFYRALKRVAHDKFDGLSPEQQGAVHVRIDEINRENAGSSPTCLHALLLIDAMAGG